MKLTRLPNGITTDKETFIGMDWSRKLMDIFDGENWDTKDSLPEVAKAYPNSILFLESTAESYELETAGATSKRKEALEAFKKYNVEAYCIPTRWTAQYRKKHNIEKTGPLDAQTIRKIGMTWARTLSRFKELAPDPLGDKISKFLIYDRYACDGEETLKLAEKYLQNYPAAFAEFMKGSDKKFRKQIGRFVAVAIEVIDAKRGFREFRRQIGNYAQGYPRMTRSEFYWWWTRTITKARLNQACEKVEKGEDVWWSRMSTKQQQIHKDVLKQADKVLKWIWQTMKTAKTTT